MGKKSADNWIWNFSFFDFDFFVFVRIGSTFSASASYLTYKFNAELESEELVQKADGSYLKKLLLDPLNEKDAGLYLCLGSNRYGYNIEKTYLNVQPSKSIRPVSTVYIEIRLLFRAKKSH